MNIENLKHDLSAGFSVALIALPLSVGIALASGAPASAGLIAAIIGGVLGAWLGGAHVAINGPAAGLIVIVLAAVNQLGFRGMLAAAVVAGAFQVLFALLKLGRKGLAFPTSVIHGMMAAIGLIIIAKQTHMLLGHKPMAQSPLMLFAEIPTALGDLHAPILVVGLCALLIMVFWPKLSFAWAKRVPAPLVAVSVAALITAWLPMDAVPLLKVPSDLSQWFIFPDFSAMTSVDGWKAAITIALVASLESVLSAAAVDKLDPQRRTSNLDRDLMSKGFCNMASAAIGGLPMIAEIVRSSANITFGAKTWRANFIHSLFILVAVVLVPWMLNLIPVTALAAILVTVGARLGNPKQILHAKAIGLDNFVGFMVTLVVTLAEDLLLGIFLGALCQFAVEMLMGLNWRHAFKASYTVLRPQRGIMLKFMSALAFSNFLPVKEEIQLHLAKGESVVLDFTDASYVDHSVLAQLHDLASAQPEGAEKLKLIFSDQHSSLGHDLASARRKVS